MPTVRIDSLGLSVEVATLDEVAQLIARLKGEAAPLARPAQVESPAPVRPASARRPTEPLLPVGPVSYANVMNALRSETARKGFEHLASLPEGEKMPLSKLMEVIGSKPRGGSGFAQALKNVAVNFNVEPETVLKFENMLFEGQMTMFVSTPIRKES